MARLPRLYAPGVTQLAMADFLPAVAARLDSACYRDLTRWLAEAARTHEVALQGWRLTAARIGLLATPANAAGVSRVICSPAPGSCLRSSGSSACRCARGSWKSPTAGHGPRRRPTRAGLRCNRPGLRRTSITGPAATRRSTGKRSTGSCCRKAIRHCLTSGLPQRCAGSGRWAMKPLSAALPGQQAAVSHRGQGVVRAKRDPRRHNSDASPIEIGINLVQNKIGTHPNLFSCNTPFSGVSSRSRTAT